MPLLPRGLISRWGVTIASWAQLTGKLYRWFRLGKGLIYICTWFQRYELCFSPPRPQPPPRLHSCAGRRWAKALKIYAYSDARLVLPGEKKRYEPGAGGMLTPPHGSYCSSWWDRHRPFDIYARCQYGKVYFSFLIFLIITSRHWLLLYFSLKCY